MGRAFPRPLGVVVVSAFVPGCLDQCPDGMPDDLYIMASSTLVLPETAGDPREIGPYGRFRLNGVEIGYLFQNPDLDTDPFAVNEWIGHLVFEWPAGATTDELALGKDNCRFVIDPYGQLATAVTAALPEIVQLPGYPCRGGARRSTSGDDVHVTFDAELMQANAPAGRVDGEYVEDHRPPVCGGIVD